MIERIEKKYPFSMGAYLDVSTYLARYGFKKVYSSRFITSLYFDYPSLSLYTDSEEGLAPRYKTRLRWYGHETPKLHNGIFEVKRTLSDRREKISVPVSAIPINRFQEWEKIKTHELRPMLFVRYFRHYYSDAKNNRATVDLDLRYSFFRPSRYKSIYRPIFVAKDRESVLELKLPNSQSSAGLLDNVPFTTLRFSKYCRGVSLLSGRAH